MHKKGAVTECSVTALSYCVISARGRARSSRSRNYGAGRIGGEWKNHCFWNVRERRFHPVSKVPSIALPAAGFPTGADRKADRQK